MNISVKDRRSELAVLPELRRLARKELMLPVLPSSGTFLDRTTSTFLVAFLTATTWSCPLPARLGILRGDCGWTKARARGASAVSSKRNP